MQTYESNGRTDYVYYPLEYPTTVFSTLIIYNFDTSIQRNNYSCELSVLLVDKARCRTFIGNDIISYPSDYHRNIFHLISLGF